MTMIISEFNSAFYALYYEIDLICILIQHSI